MAAHSLLGFLVLVCYFLLLLSAADEKDHHRKCPGSFCCGELGAIKFPFTNTSTECGLHIMGCDDRFTEKQVLLGNQGWYKIENIQEELDLSNSFSTNDPQFEKLLSSNSCGAFNYPIVLPSPPNMSLHILNTITFFRCNRNPNHAIDPENIFKYDKCPDYDIYYSSEYNPHGIYDQFSTFPHACTDIQLPIKPLPISKDPFEFLTSKINIEVTLSKSCPECHFPREGENPDDRDNFRCAQDWGLLHPPPLPPLPPPPPKKHKGRDSKKAGIIGLSIGLAGMTTIALFAILLLCKQRRNSSGYQNQPRNINSGPYSNTSAESGSVYFGVPVFSYAELQEATNNFDQSRELGEGGFGTVYYGTATDSESFA